jgi:hypothetical protein
VRLAKAALKRHHPALFNLLCEEFFDV